MSQERRFLNNQIKDGSDSENTEKKNDYSNESMTLENNNDVDLNNEILLNKSEKPNFLNNQMKDVINAESTKTKNNYSNLQMSIENEHDDDDFNNEVLLNKKQNPFSLNNQIENDTDSEHAEKKNKSINILRANLQSSFVNEKDIDVCIYSKNYINQEKDFDDISTSSEITEFHIIDNEKLRKISDDYTIDDTKEIFNGRINGNPQMDSDKRINIKPLNEKTSDNFTQKEPFKVNLEKVEEKHLLKSEKKLKELENYAINIYSKNLRFEEDFKTDLNFNGNCHEDFKSEFLAENNLMEEEDRDDYSYEDYNKEIKKKKYI